MFTIVLLPLLLNNGCKPLWGEATRGREGTMTGMLSSSRLMQVCSRIFSFNDAPEQTRDSFNTLLLLHTVVGIKLLPQGECTFIEDVFPDV